MEIARSVISRVNSVASDASVQDIGAGAPLQPVIVVAVATKKRVVAVAAGEVVVAGPAVERIVAVAAHKLVISNRAGQSYAGKHRRGVTAIGKTYGQRLRFNDARLIRECRRGLN